jgi:hypothetical protein
MKAWTLGTLTLILTISIAADVQADVAFGNVVTCPGGDPIADLPVQIYVDGTFRNTVYTNQNGQWSYDITFESCPLSILTAVLGDLHTPYVKAYCPTGRHGSGPACCVQVVHAIPCSGSIGLDDLEFRCGTPGEPPCPTQE